MKIQNKKCLQPYKLYPERAPIADPYKPVYFNHPENEKRSYAHPESLEEVRKLTFESYMGEVKIENGYPQNPAGRTGISGRGILARWGANFAADTIITRKNKEDKLEVLLIIRKDTKELAFPGGMVDKGEIISKTAERELLEETGVSLELNNAVKIYEGYVDDPRNTDNAWIETAVYHVHIDEYDPKLTPNYDEIDQAGFFDLDYALNSNNMYASHACFLKLVADKK